MIKKNSVSHLVRAPRINFQIRISKSPWEVRIHQNPTRKETRDSRGTYAMRCSNSGDLWCHSLNSAGPNDDFLSVVPGTKSISDTYVPATYNTASWINARSGICESWNETHLRLPSRSWSHKARCTYRKYGIFDSYSLSPLLSSMTTIPLSCINA